MRDGSFIRITINGIDESIEDIASIHPKVNKAIHKEINKSGREMLRDLKNITPVITGTLKRSAYFQPGEGLDKEDATFLNATLGYVAPYAPEVEMKRGMLSQTLYNWNEKLYDRVMWAGIKAIEKLPIKQRRLPMMDSSDRDMENDI